MIVVPSVIWKVGWSRAGTTQSEFGTICSPVPTPSTGFNSSQEEQSVSLDTFKQLIPIAVLDNQRVLHGRSAFDGKRRMCGAYIGVDEYKSKLAVLSEQFGEERSVWSPFLQKL